MVERNIECGDGGETAEVSEILHWASDTRCLAFLQGVPPFMLSVTTRGSLESFNNFGY